MNCSEFAGQAFAQLVRGSVTEWAVRARAGNRAPRESIGIAQINFLSTHQNILPFGHEFSEGSSYQPLSVSLKI
jgi:hypothetical protein